MPSLVNLEQRDGSRLHGRIRASSIKPRFRRAAVRTHGIQRSQALTESAHRTATCVQRRRPNAQCGAGRIPFGLCARGLAQTHIAKDRLKRVLGDWRPPFLGYHLYYPSAAKPACVRTNR